MNKILILLVLLVPASLARTQDLSYDALSDASQQLIHSVLPDAEFRGADALVSPENTLLGFVFKFMPAGFVVVPTSPLVRPVYGYSFEEDFILTDDQLGKIHAIIAGDLKVRMEQAQLLPSSEKEKIRLEWQDFLAGNLSLNPFQQWPPEGSTTSGGWIETNWTQSAPYNSMCPIDLNAGARSIVGCPATAMGQILNYHQTLNGTNLDDTDDYYHSYGSGNQYTIDDDHLERGFPSFDSLNTWLNSMEYAYQAQLPVTTEMKASLSFACGVAAHQVYSASMSGTFGIDQAWNSFQRFGFEESRLIYPEDTTFNAQIAENIKEALPVQLGLLVAPPGSGGHNVVVDGYNTDEYYHFNFGWGGSSNGWYTLPPTTIAYNLTVIEGAVLDIQSGGSIGLPDPGKESVVRLFPNPVSSGLTVVTNLHNASLALYSLSGVPMGFFELNSSSLTVSLSHLPAGLYLIRICDANSREVYHGKVLKD